jgi:hypothetical protein
MALQDFQDRLINDFSPGFQTKRSASDLDIGAAQSGQNVIISDGDKIAPTDGWELFGAADTSGNGITSAFGFNLSTGLEIPLRASDTIMEYYNEGTAAWETLSSGYTTGKRFGFSQFYSSATFRDAVYFGNGTEYFAEWHGAYSQLDGALSGGETEVVVDSVLTDRVHYTSTSSATTTTTLTISPADWVADQWDTVFYVRITSGASSGKISLISATTTTEITFTAISGLSGTPTFEIRQARFTDTGTMNIGTDTFAYTSLDQDNRFAGCTSVDAASDDAATNQAVTTYAGNPIGNIFFTRNERLFIANDTEAVLNVSATSDATDFTFGAPRAAGEGDVGLIPEGGGAIKGLGMNEDKLIVLKRNLLKEVTYSQDASDLIQLDTLIEATGVGTEAPKSVFSVDNELYYASPEGGVKAVSRVPTIDFVQALQIADPIRPTVNTADFIDAAGIFFDGRAYISARSDSTRAANNIVFVFNFQKKSWELPLTVNASAFFIYNDDLYFADSFNTQTYKMNIGEKLIREGATEFPIKATWTSGNINYGAPANRKAFNMYYVEGFIAKNTVLTVTINFEHEGIFRQVSGTIDGSNEDITLTSVSDAGLGVAPLGVVPLSSGGATVSDLNKFRVYLTTSEIPFYEHSITFETDGIGLDWEILRMGPNAIPIKQIDPKIKVALS